MAKQSEWGGGGKKMVPKMVTREGFVQNATVTRDKEKEIQGDAPLLKFYPEPQYDKSPYDPEYRRLEAKGSPKFKGGQ